MRQTLVLATLTAALLAACSSQPPAPEQKPAQVEQKPPAVSAPVTQETIDPFSVAALKDPKNILSKRSVFFNFDEYVVKEEFKPLIEAHAKFLVKNGGMKMLIQGNADERGSREYNLALGQKRAEAVKKSLLLLGGKENQIEAVSLGKEKPRCTESSEECWAQNRRDDMLYTGEY
jgi:peptidoglycan-associated lipoprotein